MSNGELIPRQPEDRRDDWGPLDRCIKWNHFMWIAGGLVAAGVFVNLFFWQESEMHHTKLWNHVRTVEEKVVASEASIEVVMSRMDHFLDSRNYMMDIYRRDMGRMQLKLDRIEETVKQIEVDFSKLHQHQLP